MIAIFDLDETLIHGDCSTLWIEWLCDKGYVDDIPALTAANEALMNAYRAQTLQQQDCINLMLAPVKHLTTVEIDGLVRRFIVDEIQPIVYQEGLTKIENYRKNGTDTIIISASPLFLVSPIAEICFDLPNAFGIDLHIEDGFFTGEIKGVIPYQDGKITVSKTYIQSQLEAKGLASHTQAIAEFLANCAFYSDSINDLPLLSKVRYPFTVNPDTSLYQIASTKEWPIFRFARISGKAQVA